MKTSAILENIRKCGVIPAIRVETEEQALQAVEDLHLGGISVAEVSMSIPRAMRVLDQILARFGECMTIGAGTVLDPETARHCILMGARFIVGPALNVATIEICRRYSTTVFAGALTPTEILTAWTAGADCVKVFPVSALGGAAYIRSLQAPLPHVQLLPMGGVSLGSAGDYIRAGSLALGVGSDLVNAQALRDRSISKIAAEYRVEIEKARNTS